MTTFVDNRAAALGITEPLSTDQRIALDRNAQLDRQATATANLAVAVGHLALTDDERLLVGVQLEALQLHVVFDRHLYAQQGVDVSSVQPAATT